MGRGREYIHTFVKHVDFPSVSHLHDRRILDAHRLDHIVRLQLVQLHFEKVLIIDAGYSKTGIDIG